MERFLDEKLVSFDEYRQQLPKRSSDFPKRRIVKDRELLATLHAEWARRGCMACGVKPRFGSDVMLQLHHIAHGGCGRSDERTNLVMLCSRGPDAGCHSDVHGGTISLGRLLRLRWQAEPNTVDWVRLAILFGYFLPDLE